MSADGFKAKVVNDEMMKEYQNQHGATPPVTSYTGSEPHRERGMMGKIKAMLPYSAHPHTTGTTAHHGGTGYNGTGHRQQKGMMSKIKNKLSGTGGGHAHKTATTTPHGGTTTKPHGGTTTYTRDKKGIMDKIKAKLRGHR